MFVFFIYLKIYRNFINKFLLWFFMIQKRELVEVFSGIHDSLLKDLKEGLSQYFRAKSSTFEPILSLMQTIHENELFQEQYSNILSSLYNEHKSCVIVSALYHTFMLNHRHKCDV